jgi:outer membrane protein OmpA-like peptidoglycan-associated protein
MRTRRRHVNIEGDDTSFWVSFSDVATALMMVFILLVVLQIKETSALNKLGVTPSQRAATIKMQEYLLKRQQIIDKLKLEFGPDTVDKKTGTFTISAGLLFDKDKWILKPEYKPKLSDVVKRWVGVVLSEEYKSRIAQIDIEGHADPDSVAGADPYLSNLVLTQNRARAVAEFVVSDPKCMDKNLRDSFLNVVSVNGRSFKDPIRFANDEIDKVSSRRVVLKFRLKDEQLSEVAGASK